MFSPNPGDEKGRCMRRKTLVAGIFENKEFESEPRRRGLEELAKLTDVDAKRGIRTPAK